VNTFFRGSTGLALTAAYQVAVVGVLTAIAVAPRRTRLSILEALTVVFEAARFLAVAATVWSEGSGPNAELGLATLQG